MTVGLLAAFLVLLGHLWYLQILEGARLQELSEKNRIRVRSVAAPRGMLLDRNGLPLVENRPAFTLALIPREMESRETVLSRLAALLRIPYAELDEALGRPADSLTPVRVRRGLTLEEVARIEEWKLELPGVVIEVEPQRLYPHSRFAAHLLGYVREANDEQLKQGRYRRGDMIGQSGLERLLDHYLRGREGGERIEVDALGRPIRVVQRSEPQPGARVVTTIDRRIQETAERAMEGHAGAVVVMDPRNGDVRAMVSTPAFEIDRFTGTISRQAWIELVKDPAHPMLNRTVQSQYAPGSVFKIVVAAAGLQETKLTPVDRMYCSGQFQRGRWTFKDWTEDGHGVVDLHRAIVHSCNVYFYQAGLRVGMDTIVRYAEAFGFGASSGIDLPGEKLGLVPGASWRRARGRRAAYWGDTVNVSIGQGPLLVTPIQVARMMSAVANGGVLFSPRLVQRVEDADGNILWADPGLVNGHVDLSPMVWAFLRQSLRAVVDRGTGWAARVPGLDVAGKTGTAQIVGNSRASRGEDHAWFASFAPASDPQTVVVVLVERGGKGGQVAAPIAKRIYHAIFFEKVASAGRAG
jgi:penicillin-binding protein 2